MAELPPLVVPYLQFSEDEPPDAPSDLATLVETVDQVPAMLVGCAIAAGQAGQDEVYMILRSVLFSIGNHDEILRLQGLAEVVAIFDREHPIPAPPPGFEPPGDGEPPRVISCRHRKPPSGRGDQHGRE